MGAGFVRHSLVERINTAFRHDGIDDSAAKVAHLDDDADAFVILHTLGLFEFDPGVTLETYRANLGIPDINKAVLTLAVPDRRTNQDPAENRHRFRRFRADPDNPVRPAHLRAADPQGIIIRRQAATYDLTIGDGLDLAESVGS